MLLFSDDALRDPWWNWLLGLRRLWSFINTSRFKLSTTGQLTMKVIALQSFLKANYVTKLTRWYITLRYILLKLNLNELVDLFLLYTIWTLLSSIIVSELLHCLKLILNTVYFTMTMQTLFKNSFLEKCPAILYNYILKSSLWQHQTVDEQLTYLLRFVSV